MAVLCQGTGGGGGQGVSNPMPKNCGKLSENRGKLRDKCGAVTIPPRSLKEHHLCTGDAQGTNTRAGGTGKNVIAENYRKLQKIADFNPHPPPRVCGWGSNKSQIHRTSRRLYRGNRRPCRVLRPPDSPEITGPRPQSPQHRAFPRPTHTPPPSLLTTFGSNSLGSIL